MKHHKKPIKSAKTMLVQKTIDNVQPGNDDTLRRQNTTSELSIPDRKQELFDQLRDLLDLVDKAFIDPDRPQFPNELCDKLLITIEELQPYIGKENSYRAPFWNCVKAVNHARPSLRLISRLDRLVARACRRPPSPTLSFLSARAARYKRAVLILPSASGFPSLLFGYSFETLRK